VADCFFNRPMVAQHRLVYDLLPRWRLLPRSMHKM
jgi:stress-induced morphogen